jgi:carbon monoxide dehydrogenase subunit G
VKIEDEFRVAVPVDQAWNVLLDVERIAPCMPGAQLQEIEGEEYRGIVKVKVGPITAQYKGAARIVEAREPDHTLILKAEGRDTRGQGNASATVTATLTPDADGTVVHIDTDLNITGKVAQFGRGVMADVSSKLLGQFAANLERDVLSGNGAASNTTNAADASSTSSTTAATSSAPSASSATTSASASAESTGVRKIDSPEAQPVDLFDTAGNAVAKRAIPIVIALVALLTLRAMRRRRKRKKQSRDE